MTEPADLLATGWDRYQSGDFSHAEELFRRATRDDPGSAVAWCYLGLVCYALGRFEEAVQCYGQSLRLRADLPMMSLPAVLGTTLETIPGGAPYVVPDERLVESYRRTCWACTEASPRPSTACARSPRPTIRGGRGRKEGRGKTGQEPFPVHPAGRSGNETLWNQYAWDPATAGKGS
jgi:tetratricopeptide (TPR) repeat protein